METIFLTPGAMVHKYSKIVKLMLRDEYMQNTVVNERLRKLGIECRDYVSIDAISTAMKKHEENEEILIDHQGSAPNSDKI